MAGGQRKGPDPTSAQGSGKPGHPFLPSGGHPGTRGLTATSSTTNCGSRAGWDWTLWLKAERLRQPLQQSLIRRIIIVVTEWIGLEGTLKITSFQLPCHGQGQFPLDQFAQSLIQPGLERLQGWGTTAPPGQPCSTPQPGVPQPLAATPCTS